jgi:hypothetical protein
MVSVVDGPVAARSPVVTWGVKQRWQPLLCQNARRNVHPTVAALQPLHWERQLQCVNRVQPTQSGGEGSVLQRQGSAATRTVSPKEDATLVVLKC